MTSVRVVDTPVLANGSAAEKISPAVTELEIVTLRWLLDWFGLPRDWFGMTTLKVSALLQRHKRARRFHQRKLPARRKHVLSA